MGCDIHLHVEHRDDAESDWTALGKWQPLGDESEERLSYFDRDRYDEWYRDGRSPHPDVVLAAMQPEAPQSHGGSPIEYRGRNYWLFAALAGVRNSNSIVPISDPRGMPGDVTVEVASEWARWGPDAHSASHFTLTELALWEGWQQTFDSEVWVAEGRHPIRRLSDQQFERLARVANSLGELPHLAPDAWNLSTCSWSIDPKNWRTLRYKARLDLGAGQDWWRYLVDLHRLGLQQGADNVRIVFWFDN